MEFYKEIEKIKGYVGLDLDYNVENSFIFGIKDNNENLVLIKCLPSEEKFINLKTNKVYNTKSFDELKKLVFEKGEEFTFGEKVIGINFNPSGDAKVNEVKELCARLIDIVEERISTFETKSWVINVFRTNAFNLIVQAQMAIVKFLTYKE